MPEPQDKITTRRSYLEATMTKQLIAAAAATALGASAASAEPPTIPSEFWGEWCTPQQDPNDANKSWYTLPSETRNGLCIQVLAIFKEGFRFNAGATGTGYEQCRPTEIEFTKNAGRLALDTQSKSLPPAVESSDGRTRSRPSKFTATRAD